MIGIGGRTRWTPTEIRSATPAVLDAARWELYASALWPGADVVADLEAPDRPLTDTQVKQQKTRGRLTIQRIRRQLLPPDEVT